MAQPARAPKPAAGSLPVATYALIIAQVVVWLVVRRYLLSGNAWTDFALRPGTPDELGLLISPFIHLDATHLGVNLAVLWLFGTNLERVIGSLRFLFLYLGAAWFASLMQWAVFTSFNLYADLAAKDAAVGSSGAVAGLLGASLVRLPRARLRIPFLPRATFPTTFIIVVWLAYTVVRALVTTVSGVTEGVGHWAHFAGFIFGLGIAQLLRLHHVAREEYLEQAAGEAVARDDLIAAAQAWSALLAMRPHDQEIRSALITARLSLGDTPGARRLAREGVDALVREQDRTLALSAYREYTPLIPDLDLPPGVRYRIGCWLAEAGEDELAFRALWESVREDGATPAAASALYRAGQVAWERLKNPLHAREAWERLLEQFPDSPWSDAARDGLRKLPAPG
jgi:membrane associated rhomboid family serine protease